MFIGIGNYVELDDLRGVHSGATALLEVLTDSRNGSLERNNCTLVPECATREEVGRAIRIAAETAEDLLLIYFAGHGLRGPHQHDLYLAVASTGQEDLVFSGLKYEDVRAIILHSAAAAKIVILDCCFSGRALGQLMSGDDDTADEVEIEGTAVLTSVPPNYHSIILPDEHYPAYTKRLVDLLRDGIPGGPDLLNLPVLHRALRRSIAAAGLRPPQANLDSLLDGLGLVRNRASAPHDDSTLSNLSSDDVEPSNTPASANAIAAPGPTTASRATTMPDSPSKKSKLEPPGRQQLRDASITELETTQRRNSALGLIVGTVTLVLLSTFVAKNYLAGTTAPTTSSRPELHSGKEIFDIDGDGRNDIATFNPTTRLWRIKGQPEFTFGIAHDLPVPADYDGDGKSDIAVYNPLTRADNWRGRGGFRVSWGGDGDVPVPSNFHGDGKAEFAVYNPNLASWARDTFVIDHFGDLDAIPVPADYAGLTGDDYATYNPVTFEWHMKGADPIKFGAPGAIPVPGDYDGRGKSVPAYYEPRGHSWHIYHQAAISIGSADDIPVPGDYNGDGKLDIAVYDPNTYIWVIKGQQNVVWGGPGEIPISYVPEEIYFAFREITAQH